MFFRCGWRLIKNNSVGRHRWWEPRLEVLEDRLPPGQIWLGDALTASVFGPALATAPFVTSDAAVVTPATVDAGSASSDAWLLPLTDATASSAQETAAASDQKPIPAGGTTMTIATNGGNVVSIGTPGLSQDSDLAALAVASNHKAPVISSSQASGTQVSGATSVTVNPVQTSSGSATTGDNAALVDYTDKMTVAMPYGVPSDGRQGTPPDQGPLNSKAGPNNIANDHTPCTNGHGVIQSETAVAVSGNAVVVGYNDFRGYYCPTQNNGYQWNGWAYSLDKGQTFTDGGPLPGGTNWRGDPWLASGPDGTIYMAGLWGAPTSIAISHAIVGDTGVTWSSPTVVNLGSPDKEAMTVDPNTGAIYFTYTSFSGSQAIKLIKSTDGGATFSSPVTVTTGSVQGSQVAVGPNGEVYVSWDIGYPTDTGIGFAYSLDGGQTYTVTTKIQSTTKFTVTGTDRTPAFPHMAVDLSGGANTGNIYIAWQSAGLSGKGDALLTRSTDGGQTWSAPLAINDNGATGIDWYPTVSVDSNGYLHSFFYDRRDNPGTNLTNVYYARSTDGGQTFEPNLRVTDTSSNFTTFSDGSPAWGDYINSTTDGNSAIVAYTDGRLGDPDAFFARVGYR
jgi:hypothetical protein